MRPWKRKRPLAILAFGTFVIGLPLVSVLDGAVLSGVGLVFELVAVVSVVLLVFAVIDEGHEGDEDGPGHG
jgi:hypothetical protein